MKAIVRIDLQDDRALTSSLGEPESCENGFTPGDQIPEPYVEAFLFGADQQFQEGGCEYGIHITIEQCLVHPVDANESVFRKAGIVAVMATVERYGR